jgi:hypothetical protein
MALSVRYISMRLRDPTAYHGETGEPLPSKIDTQGCCDPSDMVAPLSGNLSVERQSNLPGRRRRLRQGALLHNRHIVLCGPKVAMT